MNTIVMSPLKKLTAALMFATITTPALAAVTDNQVFAYAEGNYASLFSGASQSGQFQQYNYRYYPATKNYLAVDSAKTIYILGPVSNGNIQSVGPVSAFEGLIAAWEAKQAGSTTKPSASGLMGGAIQSAPLNLTAAVTTFAGGFAGSVDGTGTAAKFTYPKGITTDGGNLYVVDSGNHKIRKIVIATGVVSTLAGSGSVGLVNGTGTAASFNMPVGITTDGSSLYVADSGNNRIRKIVIATGVVSTLAGSGSAWSTDGVGTAASFHTPQGITTDGSNLYVADLGSHKIRQVMIATGAVSTLAGSGTTGAVNGTGTATSFNNPWGVATDGSNLYVADYGNHKIRQIVIATGVVSTLAGSGAQGAVDGTGTAASFKNPAEITTDGRNLYVADYGNHKIRQIVIATGVVTTLAGSGAQGAVDGTNTAASFKFPYGITTDGISLYVADFFNSKIRRLQ